jgi:hypothetical protein
LIKPRQQDSLARQPNRVTNLQVIRHMLTFAKNMPVVAMHLSLDKGRAQSGSVHEAIPQKIAWRADRHYPCWGRNVLAAAKNQVEESG